MEIAYLHAVCGKSAENTYMSDTSARSSTQERLLDQIIADYITAVEKEGAQDKAKWLQRFPQFSAELREFFDDQEQLDKFVIPDPRSSVGGHSSQNKGIAGDTDSPARLSPSPVARPPVKCGDILAGRYEVTKVLHGGMGVVYLVEDVPAKKEGALQQYAMKTVPDFEHLYGNHQGKLRRADLINYRRQVDDFRREAWNWVRLGHHSHVIHALYVEELYGKPHIIMEYADSGDLATWIKDNKLSLHTSIDWALQICRGMQYARSTLSLVHRDLKPKNILISGDRIVKVTDFGLSHVNPVACDLQHAPLKDDRTDTQAKAGRGTYVYMPPEQFMGETDVRSDVFAFGTIVFEMLTRRRLFARHFSLEWAERGQTLPSIHEVNPAVPAVVSRVVSRCLEFDPARRYPDFGQVESDLERVSKDLEDWAPHSSQRITLPNPSSFTLPSRSDSYDEVVRNGKRYKFEQHIHTLVALGRLEDAITVAESAVSADPNYDGHWINKGKAHGELNQLDEAAKCFRRAVSLRPDNALSWANLAFSFRGIGQIVEAAEAANHAVSLDDELAEAWHAKGCCEMDTERLMDATMSLVEAWKLDAHDWRIAFHLGICFRAIGKEDDAAAIHRRATELKPDSPDVWFALAETLRRQRNWKEAILAVDECLKQGTNNASGWALRATLLWDSGGSVADVSTALDQTENIDPHNEIAKMIREDVLRSGGSELI